MMYTKGIRNIFSTAMAGDTLRSVQLLAVASRYSAMVFNGQIFIKLDVNGWFSTCFHITDFSDEQE